MNPPRTARLRAEDPPPPETPLLWALRAVLRARGRLGRGMGLLFLLFLTGIWLGQLHESVELSNAPRDVRLFVSGAKHLAKTDRLDAFVLAHFAQAIRPTPRAIPDQKAREFGEILARRRQIIQMITAEKNRLGASGSKAVRGRIEAHIRWLERQRTSERGRGPA